MDNPNFLTVKEVAAILRCSPDTVRGYIIRKDLEAVKPSRDYRIAEAAVQKFLAERAGSPGRREIRCTYGRRRRHDVIPPKL